MKEPSKDWKESIADNEKAGFARQGEVIRATQAVQFFVDEATTPIENPTVVWPEAATPFLPVATLAPTAKEADAEALKFDPWGGLADHRPLGELMRARKGAYFESQRGRNPQLPSLFIRSSIHAFPSD